MNHKESSVPRLKAFLAIVCAALLFVFCGEAFAQAGVDMGSVTGTVKDPSGALVVGAACTLTNPATGVTQKAVTTSAGAYSFPYVQVGTYSLKVEAKGFEAFAIDGVIVHIGLTVTEDVTLKVGAVSTQVNVTSAAPLLQAQDAQLGTTIDSTAATDLPIFGGTGGRNFMTLITTVAGVQFTGNNQGTGTFLVHGTQSGAVDVRVNGADDDAEVFGGITIPPIPDTIQEMKVETGDNPTDTGHMYGPVVNVVTKSGTNQFRGSAWEYNENDMYNANDYFNKRSQILGGHPNRPGRFKENSFGAIFGGPVLLPGYNGHDKTFFTIDFQVTRYTDTPSYTGTLPTATMQSSNFQNLVDTLTLSNTNKTDGLGRTFRQGTILDPSTTRAIPCNSTTPDPITGLMPNCGVSGAQGIVTDPAFPLGTLAGQKLAIIRDPYFPELGQPAGCPSLAGTTNWVPGTTGGPSASCFNQLPAGRIDPNAVKLLQLFKPYPYNNVGINPNTGLNNTGTNSYGSNFFELLPRPINTQQFDVRLDHTFSTKDSAYLTWSHYNQTQQQAAPFAAPLEGGGSTPFWTTNPTYMVVVTETHVFNPNLINEYRMSDERNWNTRMDPGNIDQTYPSPNYGIQGIPQTPNNGGLPVFGVGSSISAFGSRVNVTWQKVGAWQFSDNLTKIIGKHEWKFGGEYWWTYGNIAQLPYSRGNFSYGQYSNVAASGDGGPGMADFLLNPADNAAQGAYAAPGVNALSVNNSSLVNLLGGLNGYNGNNWNKSTYHAPQISFYASDNWKITPSLTLTLGIRDDYFAPYYSAPGTESEGSFWFGGNGNQASGSAYYVAHDGCSVTSSAYFKALMASDNIPIICQPNNAANTTPKFNWAPHIAIAYRVRPNLVVRLGGNVEYGAFDSVGYGGTLGTNYPFRVSVQNGPQNSYLAQTLPNNQTATMENTFAEESMTNPNAYLPLGSLQTYSKPYNMHIPYEEYLNAAVQYQFTGHDSIEVRYVGVLGKQLESADPYHNAPNQTLPPSVPAVSVPSVSLQKQAGCFPYCTGYEAALGTSTVSSPAMVVGTGTTIPFPNLATLSGPMYNTEQISNYQSGEVEYMHQFAGGFNMDTNYTLGSCLSDAQGGQQNEGGPGNGRAPWVTGYRYDYDRCESFATSVFKVSGEYGLPFGKGTILAGNANALEDAIIGGWKLDPIWISSSGFRINVGCQGTVGGSETTAGFTGPWYQTSGTAWSCNAPLVSGQNPYTPSSVDLPKTRVTGYLNSAAFTAPAAAVQTTGQTDLTPYGVRGDQITGPGWYSFDAAAHKQFKIHESLQLEVGAMALNAFNHVHLNNPSASGYTKPAETLTGGFGTITGDVANNGSGRIWQFDGKIFF